MTQLAARRDTRRTLALLPLALLLLDAALIGAAGVVAVLGRETIDLLGATNGAVRESVGMVGPAMLVGWVAAIAVLGGYRQEVYGAGTDEFKRVLNGGLVACGLTAVGCYVAQYPLSRGFFVLAYAIGIPLLLLGRFLVRRVLHAARRRGALTRRVLIAGTRSHVDDIARVLGRERWLGYEVVGALTPEWDVAEETGTGLPILGRTTDAPGTALAVGADTIFFAGGSAGSASVMRNMFWTLEQQQIGVVVAPSVTDISSDRVDIRPVGGLPLIHVDPPTWSDASRWGKRLFDIVGSLGLIVTFSPLLMFVALRIRLHDGGPLLFSHPRIGRHGVEFPCLKFRTMVPDAADRIEAMKSASGASALLFKVKDDPRITRPGRWLRRFSIDEVPQLFNVLRGDMSLVGPRPQVAQEVALYDHAMSRRLHVRPGMTGLWQVSGRSDLTLEEAIRLDLYYVDNWSMLQDVSILARTASAVLGSRGAY
ncbi:sugar transferase [Nocardioides sp. AX2bis]|uniref:sugar transferase n=1 Tax=Nocardioides sp. AX2bis TaxID=2653157 RepID=UPI00135AF1AB|nr:sugar transferase [Nocardioides sp. AX2bis]